MPENFEYTPIGQIDYRGQHTPFFIRDADRLRHMYVIGKTGVGKSTLLLNMAISDIQKGKGCCILDPHGDIAEKTLDHVPKERITDVVYFNVTGTKHLIAFNPLFNVPVQQHHAVAASLVTTFKKIWADSWGPRLEYILTQTILSLLWYPTTSLLLVQPMLTDKVFREEVMLYVKDMHLRLFWYNEFDKYPFALRMEAISPILNKMGVFHTHPILKAIIGEQGRMDIKDIMDSHKILVCNLSKGAAGEEVSSLLGSMILGAIQQAALQRSNQPENNRAPFYCYVDECGSFLTTAFVSILSEARKYGLSLFLAHQYLDQLPEHIRSAVFGNCGTMIAFQVGNTDAAVIAKEFYPFFSATDFINLPKYSFYIKLMIDGQTSKGFSANSLPPQTAIQGNKAAVLQNQKKLPAPVVAAGKTMQQQAMNQPKLFD